MRIQSRQGVGKPKKVRPAPCSASSPTQNPLGPSALPTAFSRLVSFVVVAGIALFYAIVECDYIPVQEPDQPTGRGDEEDEGGQEGCYDCKRIPYRIDGRLTCFAGHEYDASISFGLPFESEDCQYGKSRIR